jgi:predicted ATPase/DNA-binding CsgD family transcriptional regulator
MPRAATVTAREREVLSLVAEHLTNSQIADQLSVSVRTVETHVSSLLRKLQVSDRRSLARQADRVDARPAPDRARWPSPVSTFVGREAERQALLAVVGSHRLVTVTGPGGVGKTRLALQVAQEHAAVRRDGGWFVDLVQVADPTMVVAAVASAMGVVEQHAVAVEDAVAAALRASDAVIVLDNCEHLADAARSCAERLLVSCPSLTVVATSRARLVTPLEYVYLVPGLSVTEAGGDAVTLFVERARAAGGADIPDRRRVGALCRALDGMALAIELAAARYPSLGLDGLMAALDQPLRLLTTGSRIADRHRSLRDAVAWSHDLLAADDRALLRGVSVFASWFDVDSATAVAGPGLLRADVRDGLARLADHNLLVVRTGEPTRYRLLETIRQYGAERLAELGQTRAAHDRHQRWCHEQLTVLADQEHDDAWCERLDLVAPEARAAIAWHTDHRRDPTVSDLTVSDLAQRLARELFLRGQPAEAQRRYEQAARHATAGLDRAHLLRMAAGAAAARLVGNETLRLLGEAATEAAAHGDDDAAAYDRAWMVVYLRQAPGIIAALPREQDAESWLEDARAHASGGSAASAAIATATVSGLPDTQPEIVDLTARAVTLARDAGAPLVESAALDRLCAYHLARGELAPALDTIRRRGDALRALPLDASTAFQFNDYLLMASEVHLAAGNLALAGEFADTLAELACYREQGYPAVARRIKVDAMAGDLEDAATRGERFLLSWERAGRPLASTLTTTAFAMAMVHGLLDDERRRQQWLGVGEVLAKDPASLTGCGTGFAPTFDAIVALDRDQPETAVRRLSADIDDRAVWDGWNPALWRPWYAALWAEAAVLSRHPDTDARLRRGVAATRENPVAAAILHRATDLARGNHDALEGHARTFAALGCRYQQRRTQTLLATVRRTGVTRSPSGQT